MQEEEAARRRLGPHAHSDLSRVPADRSRADLGSEGAHAHQHRQHARAGRCPPTSADRTRATSRSSPTTASGYEIAAGASCTINIRFAPAATGDEERDAQRDRRRRGNRRVAAPGHRHALTAAAAAQVGCRAHEGRRSKRAGRRRSLRARRRHRQGAARRRRLGGDRRPELREGRGARLRARRTGELRGDERDGARAGAGGGRRRRRSRGRAADLGLLRGHRLGAADELQAGARTTSRSSTT